MAIFTLAGELQETRYSQESAATTKYLLRAWQRRGGSAFPRMPPSLRTHQGSRCAAAFR